MGKRQLAEASSMDIEYNPCKLFVINNKGIKFTENSLGLERICRENKDFDVLWIKDLCISTRKHNILEYPTYNIEADFNFNRGNINKFEEFGSDKIILHILAKYLIESGIEAQDVSSEHLNEDIGLTGLASKIPELDERAVNLGNGRLILLLKDYLKYISCQYDELDKTILKKEFNLLKDISYALTRFRELTNKDNDDILNEYKTCGGLIKHLEVIEDEKCLIQVLPNNIKFKTEYDRNATEKYMHNLPRIFSLNRKLLNYPNSF